MVNTLKGYTAGTADWRRLLQSNRRRTRLVIAIFILLYAALGFLIDLYLRSRQFPNVPLPELAMALLTLKLLPGATMLTALVAIISVWVTFTFADKLMLLGTNYREITPEAASLQEKQLYNTVEEMKVAAGLHYMPRVFLIEADYMNAFASGYSDKSAMIAITKGLLEKLDRAELQAVMAHELSHIRHLDIKLTLMASVLSNLMLMLIDILFQGVLFSRDRRRDEGGTNWLVKVIIILRYVLPLITVLLMLFLSRTREYMADAGSAELTRDNEPLARALLKIKNDYDTHQEHYATEYQSTPHEAVRRESYIFDPVTAGFSAKSALSDTFSTHPSVEKRLAALGFKVKNKTNN
jgi:heat shock protein HtpX